MSDGKIITLFFVLEDISGVLSEVLSTMAKAKANILTINQNIPVNGIANITMSIRTGNINKDIEVILNELKNIDGIINIDILARE
jgi:chorismate mutase